MRSKDLNHDQEKLKEKIPTLQDCIFFFTSNNVTVVKRDYVSLVSLRFGTKLRNERNQD